MQKSVLLQCLHSQLIYTYTFAYSLQIVYVQGTASADAQS